MGIINAGPQLPASTAQRESAPEDSTFIRALTAAQADAPLFRFIDFLRPHLALIAGASMMGILRFTIPLTIPLVFKYLIDMLLTPHSHVERVNLLIDRWCIAVASLMRLGTDTSGKLVAIAVVLGALFAVQAVCCYFRNYWASKAGHRLIFDLRFGLFRHMQGLSHSFFDKHSSGSILSRFITDIHTAHESSALLSLIYGPTQFHSYLCFGFYLSLTCNLP